jgi:hypothetical protein
MIDPSRPVLRVVMAAVALLVALAACGQPGPAEAVADLQAIFPTLAQYRVTNLYRTDECEYIVYARGAFVTDPDDVDCEIDLDGPRPRGAIDRQARVDLDSIYQASEQHGARLQSAFPEYGPNGTINGGSFGFHWCTSYIYEPGWSQLPRQDSKTVTAVNADWYEIHCL